MIKGKMAAFWSPFHGQTATTSNAVAIGTYMGITRNISTLLMHNQICKSNMENAFTLSAVKEGILEIFSDSGVDALMKLARTKRLCPENFKDYTNRVINDRLDILIGTNNSNESDYENLNEMIQYIINCAKDSYGLVICDVNAGFGELSLKALEAADIIIVCLNQNAEVLKTFFEKKEWNEVLNSKPYLVLLGNFEKKSACDRGFIKKTYEYKESIFAIPRNVSFLDAYNSSSVMEFFMKNQKANPSHPNYDIIFETNKACEALLRYLSVDSSLVYSPIQSLTVFDYILRLFK